MHMCDACPSVCACGAGDPRLSADGSGLYTGPCRRTRTNRLGTRRPAAHRSLQQDNGNRRQYFYHVLSVTRAITHPFNGPLPGITRVSRYQKGKTNLDFTEARDSEWQWHQLGRYLSPDR